MLGITEEEWALLVKTTGRIRDIQNLTFSCKTGSREFRPFQAFADVVKNARSLHKLEIHLDGRTFPNDSSGLTALANALREDTALREITLLDYPSLPCSLHSGLALCSYPANNAASLASRSLLSLGLLPKAKFPKHEV
jgi:hypothetical protein